MNTAFAGKKLLVVGGTSGMGLATTRRVVEQGGQVVLVGNRQQKAEQARQALAAEGNVEIIVADLMSEAGMARVMESINAKHQDISLLVNAAGVFFPKPFIEHEIYRLRSVYESQPRDLFYHPRRGAQYAYQ